MGCFVTLVAIVAFPIALVVGGAYELVRRIDRPNALGDRGHWLVAIATAALLGWVAFAIWRGSA